MITEAKQPTAVHRSSPLLSSKVSDLHLNRWAIVYVRQSTAAQVVEHRESTEMQYNLKHRAEALGWPSERITIIDTDQGQSGASAVDRLGFQRLLAEVSLNHVGLVLGIEMSRLARSNKDWHHLLELCSIFRTLLADQDGVYDPSNHNDRLLLGLKGTMSEAELHVLRNRLHLGKQNKAKRGELFAHAPRGFIKSPAGQLMLDPDEQVQSTIALCFEKFEQLGSGRALLRWLRDNDIRLPVRPAKGPDRGNLLWKTADHGSVYELLHHPIYAGAYCYGRTQTLPTADRQVRRKTVPMEEWQVLMKDRLPCYISWEQYTDNIRRLTGNAFRSTTQGAPRAGKALLGGVVKCGLCNRRMSVVYSDKHEEGRYVCNAPGPGVACQSIQARDIDEQVIRQLLRALEPAALELSMSVIDEIEREYQSVQHHWKQRMERAQYIVDRAARQYHAVEPENRLVARELERRWESALRDQQQLQEEFARLARGKTKELTEEDIENIKALSADIAKLWHLDSTTNEQRKIIIRHLIEEVTINVQGKSDLVAFQVRWSGGFESHHEFRRSVLSYDRMNDFDSLRTKLLQLRQKKLSANAIAQQLNREGFRTARGGHFKAITVQFLLNRNDVKRHRDQKTNSQLPESNRWSASDLVARLGIPKTTLCHWCRRGWVRGCKNDSNRWIIWADEKELRRLKKLAAYQRSELQTDYPSELTTPRSFDTKS